MNQMKIREARWRIVEYKTLLLTAYDRMTALLHGELEPLLREDKGDMICEEIVTLQNQINKSVVKIGNALTDQLFFVGEKIDGRNKNAE